MIDHVAAQLAMRTQLVTVTALPAVRAWENKDFTPTQGTPYITDQWVPGTHRLMTAMAQGGSVTETGFYVVQWFGLWGADLSDIRGGAGDVLLAFTPGSSFAISGGGSIHIRSDTAPVAGQIVPLDNGFSSCTIKIPWQAFSVNAVAA